MMSYVHHSSVQAWSLINGITKELPATNALMPSMAQPHLVIYIRHLQQQSLRPTICYTINQSRMDGRLSSLFLHLSLNLGPLHTHARMPR